MIPLARRVGTGVLEIGMLHDLAVADLQQVTLQGADGVRCVTSFTEVEGDLSVVLLMT